jgi:hypothetical protein
MFGNPKRLESSKTQDPKWYEAMLEEMKAFYKNSLHGILFLSQYRKIHLIANGFIP